MGYYKKLEKIVDDASNKTLAEKKLIRALLVNATRDLDTLIHQEVSKAYLENEEAEADES